MALLANALENSVCSPHDASGGDALRVVGYERLGRVAARVVGTVGAVGGGGAPKVGIGIGGGLGIGIGIGGGLGSQPHV